MYSIIMKVILISGSLIVAYTLGTGTLLFAARSFMISASAGEIPKLDCKAVLHPNHLVGTICNVEKISSFSDLYKS
ncbi:hypothetical protein BDV33DRAFT_80028 [Aspergillus novoparasiticus]|uniref:Uncharacterized protein n=1 Tax=Aspergillus novoparasiticus TaxID=986946 RepID=A0A5N6EVC4_9EURO|nr:hypothetical protein BDV33DRAFT_80028 [Aspergillus novoparasiticus]